MHEAHDGETADANTRPKYLTKDSKALAALRKIVLDPKWLKTLQSFLCVVQVFRKRKITR